VTRKSYAATEKTRGSAGGVTRAGSAEAGSPAGKPRRGGRRIEIDAAELEELACLQCTIAEAAAWFSVSQSTLARRLKEPLYAAAWSRGAGKGRLGLRRAQLNLAEKNATMAIFLGKQILGQKEQSGKLHGNDDKTSKPGERPVRDEIARRIAGIASRRRSDGDPEGPDGSGGG
jgi:predicted DNA-binding protein (UPF0251 family)